MLDAELIRPEQRRPLRRTEYERLVELGAFKDERVELLFGMLVAMSPQGAFHFEVVSRLARLLDRRLGDRADVRSQGPLALADDSEPEPDVMVLPPGDYRHELPRTAWLVVEVAATSANDDRSIKGRLYARARIPEYWLVDLAAGVVEVYTAPEGGVYTRVARAGRADVLRPAMVEGVEVRVGEFLPAE